MRYDIKSINTVSLGAELKCVFEIAALNSLDKGEMIGKTGGRQANYIDEILKIESTIPAFIIFYMYLQILLVYIEKSFE